MKHFVPEKEAHSALSLCERNSGLEMTDDGEPPLGFVIVAGRPVGVHPRKEAERQPQVPALSGDHLAEIWLGHADNRQRDVVQVYGLAYDRTVAAKFSLLIAVIQDGTGWSICKVIGWLEQPTQCGPDTHGLEKFSRNERSADSRSLAVSIHVDVRTADKSR
jgi:hypothetical protein